MMAFCSLMRREKGLKPPRRANVWHSVSATHRGLSHNLSLCSFRHSLFLSIPSLILHIHSHTHTFAETKISRKPLTGLKLVCVIDSHSLSGAPHIISTWDLIPMTSLMSLSLFPASCSLFPEHIRYVKWTGVANNSIQIFCFTTTHFYRHYKSIWLEDRMECCHTSVDCGQEKTVQLLCAFPLEIFTDVMVY